MSTFLAKYSPRLAKWLIFDLACGLLPIGIRVLLDYWRGADVSFVEVVSNGELALIAAVLMASCAGELYLMNTAGASDKVLRMFCGAACGCIVLSSSLYFALVKAAIVTPDWCQMNCAIFGTTIVAGAFMTTWAESSGD